jgi:hypothetical protein
MLLLAVTRLLAPHISIAKTTAIEYTFDAIPHKNRKTPKAIFLIFLADALSLSGNISKIVRIKLRNALKNK